MIVLIFRKDLESISNTETFLRFRINDTDIIGTAHLTDPDRNDFRVFHDLKNWWSIIHFSFWGLRAVRALDVVHTTWIEDISETGQDLLLKRIGNNVVVSNMLTDDAAQVSYRDLLAAWTAFAHETHDYVLQKFPETVSRSASGDWLGWPSPSEIKEIHACALSVAKAAGYE
jgi:hypothetical protein